MHWDGKTIIEVDQYEPVITSGNSAMLVEAEEIYR